MFFSQILRPEGLFGSGGSSLAEFTTFAAEQNTPYGTHLDRHSKHWNTAPWKHSWRYTTRIDHGECSQQ